jgi:glycosidase
VVIPYELKARVNRPGWPSGLSQSDLIYLLMPDRFSNGDPSNDVVQGMKQTGINRDSMFWRHGGDLKGVMNHLDYLQDLGITALWINPVLENDQPKESYHGYAITDHYRVDRRFGDNELFRQLSENCGKKGIKMVMDVVYNHVGNEHYLYKKLPWQNWIHAQPEGFQRTSYRAPVLTDPYASEADKRIMTDGWFDKHMPDLNQKDPHLAAYLIQNSIWWIEYAGLDAFRIDTYAYPDLAFMKDLLARIFKEYPKFSVFGETWVDGAPVQVFFHQNKIDAEFKSNLPGVTDFQLYYGIQEALTKEMGWTEGVARLYHTMATDYLHADPTQNVVFLDNHDISRFFSVVNEDFRKYKMALVWLMTVRGIPQLYYGNEILMKNYANPDGRVREDFPGGWAGDKVNLFDANNRKGDVAEVHALISKLARWRKASPVIKEGKTTQFVPDKGVYVYSRRANGQAILVVMNCSEKANKVGMKRYEECFNGKTQAKDVLNDRAISLGQDLEMEPWSVVLMEF